MNDGTKMAGAALVLVGSLALLGFQLKDRLFKKTETTQWTPPAAVMEGEERSVRIADAVAWSEPTEGIGAAAMENPFLRPKTAPRKSDPPRTKRVSTRTNLELSGIRLGSTPTAVINDRILTEGESIAGWRVVSIEWGRVTLRNSDGRQIRLAG